MVVDGLLVESVHLGCLGVIDLSCERFDGCQCVPGEMDPRALGREGACDSGADCASGSVDDCNFVVQDAG
jgi:hypothetical protein